MKRNPTSKGERGSALLIVFVFAAVVAIMLYMEMPVSVFEAQRDKEQLLIDRGNEYVHAVKLYVRKMGRQYPPSFEALESTNRMRFLRKRYKDPFTGKDDWRLLHAGPNGLPIDSKVNPISNVTGAGNSPLSTSSNTTNGTANSSSGGFNSTSSSSGGFGGFNSGSSTNLGATGDVVVPAIPQRPPAISANGAAGQEGSAASPQQDSLNALMTGSQANAPQTTAANNGQPAGANGLPVSSNPQSAAATNNNMQFAASGQAPNQNQTTPQAGGINSATGGLGAPGAGSSPFGSSSGSAFSSSKMGVIQSGSIAGVASKAEGHSIKSVNDQENYSLWEFYYDPTKDAAQTAAGALAQIGGSKAAGLSNSSSAPGANPSSGFGGFGSGSNATQNNSPFGSSGGGQNNSGFGNSGFGSSNGFGNSGFSNSNNQRPTTSTSSQPPQ